MNGQKNIKVQDSKGRTLMLIEPSFYDLNLGIYTKVPPGLSGNEEFLDRLRILLYVRAIGDEVVGFDSMRDIESVTNELGREGFEAVIEGIAKHFNQALIEEAAETERKK